ncbi:YceD family protein [Faecalibacter rhinopitheci]|uniref:DUF177 domain-containing protein n=1 Tax=Faecalibacter rhinopitheci TaxID=2779678 RepID=A0A8J7FUD1_9FLAO|nr:DUF177 domain-containing protein [Faecalibacter rhinopitheci]MBF0596531.1 DUF177 domain-containing protein [Faecalibacter rhinopitheci]MBQ0147303.1 DUF177 domain-containing protein [Candidatus Onthonaster equi]
MDKLKNYNIIFSGLPLGITEFEYEISQSFFDLFEIETDFDNPAFKIAVAFEKKSTMLELIFQINGTINVVCDVTGEKFDQKISNEVKLIVKFGHEFDNTDSEIWIIPFDEYELNIAQLIYELIMTSLPLKRLHPKVLEGNIDPETAELLDEYSIYDLEHIEDQNDDSNEDDENDDDIDPRWAKLKDLKP